MSVALFSYWCTPEKSVTIGPYVRGAVVVRSFHCPLSCDSPLKILRNLARCFRSSGTSVVLHTWVHSHSLALYQDREPASRGAAVQDCLGGPR
jgi:hypothetical protein